MYSKLDLSDKIIVITGAASANVFAAAEKLASASLS